jgi:GNAT superfamily N-acetyltransferase
MTEVAITIRSGGATGQFVDSLLVTESVDMLPTLEKDIEMTRELQIRSFRAEDGAACHELRHAAFLGVFSTFLPPNAVLAGAKSYGVSEFTERIGAMETCIAVRDEVLIGFCTIRVLSATHAELLYLYVASDHRGTGVGSQLARHAEQQLLRSHPGITTLFLDTAVPEYNQSFWERLGYRPVGPSSCDYPSGRIPAVRLEKRVGSPGFDRRFPEEMAR